MNTIKLILITVSILLFVSCNSKSDDTLPNIIFILADDIGYGDPGCYNPGSKIPTPHIDKLAKEGIRFTDAHAPSSVCTPTRYGILTGRYCWRSPLKEGVLWGYDLPLIENSRLTLPKILKNEGYQTACIGKWHLGLPWQFNRDKVQTETNINALHAGPDDVNIFKPLRDNGIKSVGFDYFYGIPASLDMDPYVYFENDKQVSLPTDTVPACDRNAEDYSSGFWRGGPIAPEFKHQHVLPVITAQTVKYIENNSKNEKPFFLYVALTAPHTPWLPTEEFRGKSQAGKYGDFVFMVDHAIGQITQSLQENNLEEKTLLVFTSDNGAHIDYIGAEYEHAANYIWRGQKADIYEGGHRIPLLVKWPGKVKPGRITNQLVCLTDFIATFAEVVQYEIPQGQATDSYSFMSALKNPSAPQVRNEIVMHSLDGMFAVRAKNWKFIDGRGSGGFTSPKRIASHSGKIKGQLFNLSDDPKENNNLYFDYPEKVAELKAILDSIKSAENDVFIPN